MTINGFATCTDMLFSLLVTLAEELKDWDLKSKYIPALNIGTCAKKSRSFLTVLNCICPLTALCNPLGSKIYTLIPEKKCTVVRHPFRIRKQQISDN